MKILLLLVLLLQAYNVPFSPRAVGGGGGRDAITVVLTTGAIQSSNTATFTITHGMTLVNDDYIVGFVCKDDNFTITPPAGWTEVDHQTMVTDTDSTSGIWYKKITDAGSEPAAYAWTADNEAWVGGIVQLRGVDLTTPIDATGTYAENINDTTPSATGFNTLTGNSRLFGFLCVVAMTAEGTIDPPADLGEIFDIETTGSANDVALELSHKNMATAGATNFKTWGAVETTHDAQAYLVAFRPAP